MLNHPERLRNHSASDSSFGENDNSRTGFTNRELQYATKAHFYGLFGQAVPDTRTSIFRPGQFANSAHSEVSTQTRNLHACVNPLQRLGSSPLPIHETWRTDKSGSAGAGFRGPVRNAVGSSPISTIASAEEPIQDSRNVNRRPKPERSKR